MTEKKAVATPTGPAKLWMDEAPEPRLRLLLGHGAGGGPEARDLAALARELPEHGVSVLRFEQPWRIAGKKIAPRPALLDEAWLAIPVPADLPLVVGGRSSGARVACRTATAMGASGVVALAFPLHPPGKPEKSRLDELTGAGVPTLVVQGERDSFGRPAEFGAGPFTLASIAHADHGMAVPKANNQADALSAMVGAVREFVLRFAG
ncbi:alpha/beta family hydrolase [Phytoactinopolyspora alkaliphila]|nr:alpha/beta family hydrolase [Phytoactinopolyspora alkaliphila]